MQEILTKHHQNQAREATGRGRVARATWWARSTPPRVSRSGPLPYHVIDPSQAEETQFQDISTFGLINGLIQKAWEGLHMD
jgi:hypothetical protein